jgi:hypothetical protein
MATCQAVPRRGRLSDKVASLLADRKLEYDPDSTFAAAFQGQINFLSQLSALIAIAEARRDRHLRTIERRHQTLGIVISAEPVNQLTLTKKSRKPKKKSTSPAPRSEPEVEAA